MVQRSVVLNRMLHDQTDIAATQMASEFKKTKVNVKRMIKDALTPIKHDNAYQPSINLKAGDIIRPYAPFSMSLADINDRHFTPDSSLMLLTCDNGITYPPVAGMRSVVRTIWVQYDNINPRSHFDLLDVTAFLYFNQFYLVAWLVEYCEYITNIDLSREYIA